MTGPTADRVRRTRNRFAKPVWVGSLVLPMLLVVAPAQAAAPSAEVFTTIGAMAAFGGAILFSLLAGRAGARRDRPATQPAATRLPVRPTADIIDFSRARRER